MVKWNRKDSKRLLPTTTEVEMRNDRGGVVSRGQWCCISRAVEICHDRGG